MKLGQDMDRLSVRKPKPFRGEVAAKVMDVIVAGVAVVTKMRLAEKLVGQMPLQFVFLGWMISFLL